MLDNAYSIQRMIAVADCIGTEPKKTNNKPALGQSCSLTSAEVQSTPSSHKNKAVLLGAALYQCLHNSTPMPKGSDCLILKYIGYH